MNFVSFEKTIDRKRRYPAVYARRVFAVGEGLLKASLKITACGTYEGYLNGTKLGNQVLTPGYTDYNYRLQYQEYDVTKQLVIGFNVLGAIIGDGWYRGAIGIGSKRNCYGDRLKLGFELTLQYENGTVTTVEADEQVTFTQYGPLRENDLKVLERYDARLEQTGWLTPDFNDSGWMNAFRDTYQGMLIPEEGELILEQDTFYPTVLHTPNGETVLDFGQNHSGRVHFRITGQGGETVNLTMGEVLDEQGNFTMKNLVAEGASLISGDVGQQLVYTLKPGVQEFAPVFLISGFRYVKLENWPEEVKAENFYSRAIYSDIKDKGTFACSNELINQFVKNSAWSRRSNFVDIPSDCPTRERAGWTGDISVYTETALYMSDPTKFLKKWLKDFILEQRPNGNLPYVIPEGGYDTYQLGTLGWSDAIAFIPMTLYRFTGDLTWLSDVYDTVKHFVEFNVTRAKKKNPLFLLEKRESERDYVVEVGFHYGEWLEPTRPMYQDFIRDIFYPDREFTTAFFYQLTLHLAQMADLLEKPEDAVKYHALAENIRSAYRHYFLKNGTVDSNRHCRYVRPVSMGLATEEEARDIIRELNRKIVENDYCIGTGFHTTWRILETLTNYGYVDTAYRMLENTKSPSWLYEVTKGATTTWENWNGIDANGMPTDSHNHFAPGASVAWLFKYCAGIQPTKPGFTEIRIAPVIGGTLTWAKATYESVQGRIVSEWHREGSTITLTGETPVGVPTVIHLPDDTEQTTNGGEYRYEIHQSL